MTDRYADLIFDVPSGPGLINCEGAKLGYGAIPRKAVHSVLIFEGTECNRLVQLLFNEIEVWRQWIAV